MPNTADKPGLLLHICCIGCGAYVLETLGREYDITLFFYNPNIYPEKEYRLRLEETEKTAKRLGLPLLVGRYGHDKWLEAVKGLEQEPERGKRCLACYEYRLRKTAEQADKEGIPVFAATLTISPHKDADAVSRIGNGLAREYGLRFHDQDFKKKDGFKKTCEISRRLGLYRQDYCGCEFSI